MSSSSELDKNKSQPASSMNDVRDQLPPEIRDKQRKLVHAHNRRIWLLAVGFFALCFVAIQILKAQFLSLGIGVLIVDLVVTFYAGFILIPRADARHCVRIGFVCPACGAPLYRQSSTTVRSALITRGVCPSCEHSFLSSDAA